MKKRNLSVRQLRVKSISEAYSKVDPSSDYTDIGKKLYQQLLMTYALSPDTGFAGIAIVELAASYCVYVCGGQTWKILYTIRPNGDLLLGQRAEVQATFVPLDEGHATVDESIGCLYDCRQASKYLRVSESMVRKLIARRAIPFVALGRRKLFRRFDLDAWVAEHIVPTTDEVSHEASHLAATLRCQRRNSRRRL
jgi:excisionase family DNA binding protein